MKAVPVFMYHHVNRNAGDLVTLTPEGFENHLRVIRKRRIRTLFLGDLARYLRGEESLPGPSALLTFDDGHLDNWVYAFPLLEEYGIKATIFVITSWLGGGEVRARRGAGQGELPEIPRHREVKRRAGLGDTSVALSWGEARAMEESGLVDIQCHTHFHRDYFLAGETSPRLDPSKRDLFLEDLACSKKNIEERLGKTCRYLSWPWGKYDAEALSLAANLGFEATVTTEKGVNFPGSDERAIKRIVAKSGDERWFAKRLTIYSNRTLGRLYSRLAGKI